MNYPHIVIRWMPAVYGRKQILKGEISDSKVLLSSEPCKLTDSLWSGERLSWDGVAVLSLMIQTACDQYGRSLCLVLGKDKCTYFRPFKALETSSEPPSGGLSLDTVWTDDDFAVEDEGAGSA